MRKVRAERLYQRLVDGLDTDPTYLLDSQDPPTLRLVITAGKRQAVAEPFEITKMLIDPETAKVELMTVADLWETFFVEFSLGDDTAWWWRYHGKQIPGRLSISPGGVEAISQNIDRLASLLPAKIFGRSLARVIAQAHEIEVNWLYPTVELHFDEISVCSGSDREGRCYYAVYGTPAASPTLLSGLKDRILGRIKNADGGQEG